jgi:N utilization substance protein B
MASKKHNRTADRIKAVQVLYTCELQDKPASELLGGGLCIVAREHEQAQNGKDDTVFNRIEEGTLTDYSLKLITGVEEHLAEIDERLAETSENWALSRMPFVDRAILRMAVYEMLYCPNVPISVTINEAVELAKDFGGEEDSPRFVNGVLGRIARSLEQEEQTEAVKPYVVGAAGAAAVVQLGVKLHG